MPRKNQDEYILKQNVAFLDERVERLAEKRYAAFSELAESIARGITQENAPPDLLALAPTMRAFAPKRGLEEAPPYHHRLLSVSLPLFEAADSVAFTQAFLKVLAEMGHPITLEMLLPAKAPEGGRVAYFHTPYTDEAYENFAGEMENPTVLYTDSFRHSCEALRSGDADYCILPYENSEGVLPAMAALADRHGLFRTATCRVFHADGTDATHFALYAASPILPRGEDAILSASLSVEDDLAVAKHIGAMKACGLSLIRLQAESGEGEARLSLLIEGRVMRPDLLPLLAYLTIFPASCHFHGLYKEIGK